MVRYDKQIISALLDSYENSRAFKNENKINRNVQFVVSRRTLPAYFDFEDKALFENTVRAANVVEKNDSLLYP